MFSQPFKKTSGKSKVLETENCYGVLFRRQLYSAPLENNCSISLVRDCASINSQNVGCLSLNQAFKSHLLYLRVHVRLQTRIFEELNSFFQF